MASRRFQDALGRAVKIEWPPRRVASLVPSQTETLHRLGLGPRLVGRTRYCVEPRGEVEIVPEIGGEKSPDVSKILALQPDLVIGNKEENRKADVERLEAAGIPVYLAYPRTVREGIQMVRDLGALVGCEERGDEIAAGLEAVLAEAPAPNTAVSAACFIWKNPWMAVGADTYIDDMLKTCGARNVVPGRIKGRYPRVELEEVLALAPGLVLLPDEPYAFTERDLADFERGEEAASPRAVLLDGKILSWYGPRIGASVRALRAIVSEAAARCG